MSFGKGVADPSPPARDDTRTSFRDPSPPARDDARTSFRDSSAAEAAEE
jgi:hypothetical protein